MRARRRAEWALRRRTRGAIFVEAIIVCTLLTLFMAAGIFMHRLYWTQLVVVGQARAAAWTQALAGCNGAASLDGIHQANGPNAPDIELDAEAVPSYFGNVQHTKGTATDTVLAPIQVGGKSYRLDGATTLACNEIPASKRGDVASVFGYVASTLLPHFF